ncbi:hypothetical protein NSB25_17485 [Acetatifactor muris]|uniref:hypothetical protein n=1 Tax=Acetatifactor muris TaxID=879566 RepID=UPI00214B940A|nr:hypothetical protein [Acetatifactor muris]MCR2049065.1 hypothetical protein [Acetatifactor muris]
MRRKTYRRLVSLVTAGAAALSLLFSGETALAFYGGGRGCIGIFGTAVPIRCRTDRC